MTNTPHQPPNVKTHRRPIIGPGIIVAAAFIGPGTVTTSTLAGSNFGYTLLWALLFATLATMILQEMSARLGLIGRKGLGATLASELSESIFRWPLIILIVVALYGGNSAYEAGNLAGASLGIEAIINGDKNTKHAIILVLALLAGAVLASHRYRIIERILIALVLMMSLAFVATFFVVTPSLMQMFAGLTRPSLPSGSLLTVIALIGTTVVPYNLFLHAAAAKQRFSGAGDLTVMRTDTILSIGLGGLITILIVSTAAASLYDNALTVNNAADMARQFEPLFGDTAKILLGTGLCAAGLSSAITAPLATAYAITEILPSKSNQALYFRTVALSVLLNGTVLALTGIKPIKLIVLAQFANGLILPIVAAFLLWAMNRQRVLGEHTNGVFANTLGIVVIVFTAFLGLRLIAKAIGF